MHGCSGLSGTCDRALENIGGALFISHPSLKHIWALFMARNLELFATEVRWPGTLPFLFWSSSECPGCFRVPHSRFLKWRGGEGPEKTQTGFRATPHVQWVAYEKADEAILKLRRHKLDFLWQPPDHYWVNDTSS